MAAVMKGRRQCVIEVRGQGRGGRYDSKRPCQLPLKWVVSVAEARLLRRHNYRRLAGLFSVSDRQSCKQIVYSPAAAAH